MNCIVKGAPSVRSSSKPFNEISGVVTELQNALACSERVFEIIEAPIPCDDSENAPENIEFKGKIEFREVCFSYSPEKPLIQNFNFTAVVITPVAGSTITF